MAKKQACPSARGVISKVLTPTSNAGRQKRDDSGQGTDIVRHLAHQPGGQLQKYFLHVYSLFAVHGPVQEPFCIIQDRGQGFVEEDLEIGVAKKAQASFSLNPPQISIGVDDAISYSSERVSSNFANFTNGIVRRRTKQIPRPRTKEGAFDEELLVLQHMLNILRITDDYGGGQRWDTDFESRETCLMVGTNEPVQQLVSRLKKPQAVAS